MRSVSRKRRPIAGPLLCGLFLAASCLAAASPVSAQPDTDRYRQVSPPPNPAPTPAPEPAPAPTPNSGPTPSVSVSSGGGNSGRDIAIGVGIGIGVGLIGLILHNIYAGQQPQGAVTYELPPNPPLPQPHPRASGGFRQGGNNGRGGVPPNGEHRFVPDEVLVEFSTSASAQSIDRIARRYGLIRLEVQSLPLIGSTLYRWRIGSRRSVPNMTRALQTEGIVASVQPNYLFALQEQALPLSAAPTAVTQYALGKMQIAEAHELAVGRGVLVALIDSEIDEAHPDLDGRIAKSFDAAGGDSHPHPHGTAMAGAIASHGQLQGVAPGAQLLAARAFGNGPGSARGTSFAIYKSLQWAADNRAQVVNMSFAGPADPGLTRMLAAAYERGIVLVAAAGNAGPKSPPLYPGADANVIAVTATDADDHIYRSANRGPYLAVAAPGVQVLALAPDGSYAPSTGTSIASAEVSGIAALLLEHKPALTPSEIRTLLTKTAKPIGPQSEDAIFGSGLVNAYRALLLESGKIVGMNQFRPGAAH
jgi:subtilisin family serine protease